MSIRTRKRRRFRPASLEYWTTASTRWFFFACMSIAVQNAIAGPSTSPPSALYDIPAGTLDDALQAFAKRSNVQLLYSPGLVRGKRSTGLFGDHLPTAALARLIAEHGLTAVLVSPNTYLLQKAKQQPRSDTAPVLQPTAAYPASVQDLAPVDVTGTRIPRTSLELSFPVTVITAGDIERSGQRTLYELLSAQPGLTSHHPIAVAGEGNNYPLVPPSGASLYSLGPRATLYLVDGKRIAQFGLASTELGGIFDLSNIPLSFIDRIEILRGGASAIYGADAMAGTINIILKKDYTGGEVSSRLGVSQRGDAQSRQVSAHLGMQTRSGGSLLLAADITSQDELGGNRRDWHTTDRSRFGFTDERYFIGFVDFYDTPLLPLPQCQAAGEDPDSPYCRFDIDMHRTLQPGLLNRSLYARWAQTFGNSISFNVSGFRTQSRQEFQHRPIMGYFSLTPAHPDYAKAPAGTSAVYYPLYELGAPRNHSTSVTNNISADLEGMTSEWNWRIALSHSDSRAHSTVDNVIVSSKFVEYMHEIRFDGSDNTNVIKAMGDTIRPAGSDSIDTFEATANRKLFDAPGGPVQIEMGAISVASHRRHAPDPLQLDRSLALASTGTAPYDLHDRNSAVFAELDLPLHRTLQLDLAVRLDHHDGFRSNTSPRLGARWTPSPSLLVRASVGQGYRAPSLNDKRAPFNSFNETVYLRASPQLLPCIKVGNRCKVTHGTSENPNLRPEYSRSQTAGMVWAPTHAFNVSLDGYRIVRTDEFGIADSSLYPSLFPHGLVRDANGVLYQANMYLANIGKSETRGWELESSYLLRSESFGELDFHLAAHYLDRYVTSTIIQPKPIEHAGYDAPKLTLSGSARWRSGNWTTTMTMRHYGPYRAYAAGQTCPQVNRDAGKCTNPSLTLFGLSTEYSRSNRWTHSFGINNLFDRSPVNYRSTWGGYNIAIDDVYGRYFSLASTYRF